MSIATQQTITIAGKSIVIEAYLIAAAMRKYGSAPDALDMFEAHVLQFFENAYEDDRHVFSDVILKHIQDGTLTPEIQQELLDRTLTY